MKVESKIGSLDNVKHRPGGGDKKIFDDKEYLRQKSAMSNENNSISGSQVSVASDVTVILRENWTPAVLCGLTK